MEERETERREVMAAYLMTSRGPAEIVGVKFVANLTGIDPAGRGQTPSFEVRMPDGRTALFHIGDAIGTAEFVTAMTIRDRAARYAKASDNVASDRAAVADIRSDYPDGRAYARPPEGSKIGSVTGYFFSYVASTADVAPREQPEPVRFREFT